MRIAVASDDRKTIVAHFGRARCFVVYETEGREIKNRSAQDNTFTHHSQETGHQHAEHECHSSGSSQHSHGPFGSLGQLCGGDQPRHGMADG